MPITDISFRRGTSTILGTIIFIGIMFTAVIPMLLVMRQADTIHTMRKYELEMRDEERSDEELYVYVFPDGGVTSTNITVTVQNKGELVTSVVRLWINDEPFELNVSLQPMSETQILGTYPLTPEDNGTYYITLSSERGRVFGVDTELIWDDTLGWTTGETFSVNVLITSLPGHEFKIEVHDGGNFSVEGQTEKFDPKFFLVPQAGYYTVKIFRGNNLLYTKDLEIKWPNGPPVEWVFA